MTAVVVDDLQLRFAVESDLDQIMVSHARVFGTRADMAYRDTWRRLVSTSNILLAVDESAEHPTAVGSAMYYDMSLIVPGGSELMAAGGGMSLVEPTHRRRGVYRRMYSNLLETVQSRGIPILVGMPSQGTIYRRFGLGPATSTQAVRIDRRFAELAVQTAAATTVRSIGHAEARKVLPSSYLRYMQAAVGSVSRSGPWWELYFTDGEDASGLQSERFYFRHPEGHAAYRLDLHLSEPRIVVEEVCAASAAAHSDLWSAILGIDSFDSVTASLSVSDPLLLKLDDLRAIKAEHIRDGLWVRLMDIASALSARSYGCDGTVILAVEDPVGLASGVFRLTVSGGQAECVNTSDDPDYVVGLDDLGSLYLGGYSAHRLSVAGRIELQGKPIDLLDAMFRTLDLPFCSTSF